MEQKTSISVEVKKTLQAFDNDVILEANPFLFKRIQAKRQSSRNHGFALKINLKSIALALLVIMNLATAVYYYEWNTKKNLHERLVSNLKEDLKIEQSQNIF